MDPNEGSTKDAFKAYCNGQDTCIRPIKNANEVNLYQTRFTVLFLQFDYSVSDVALRILRLKYDHIVQNITYGCSHGVDGFINVKFETANGQSTDYAERGIRVASNVSIRNVDSLTRK